MRQLDWQPVVNSLAFALKAGALVGCVAWLFASDPDVTEAKAALTGAVVAGVVRHFSANLPPWMRA